MASSTMVVSPIMAALIKAEDIIGKNRIWTSINTEQKKFLDQFFSKRAELSKLSEKELRSWVSFVASELNEILAQEGFDIRLEDFAPDEFGVVSILDVLVEWLAEGKHFPLQVNGREYPAVRLNPSVEVGNESKMVFKAFISPTHSQPVAVVYTKSGDRVYMTVAERPEKDFALVKTIEQIRSAVRTNAYFDYLMFPMADLNQQVDISWLVGMQTTKQDTKDPVYISQAKQQTKFKMNQFGARVKSAVTMVMKTTSVRRDMPLIIDKPFLLWIEREGVSFPVMYAYLDIEDWKDPGDLQNM